MSNLSVNFDHILVPYDFSETAQIALNHAAHFAAKFNAKLSLLNVKENGSSAQSPEELMKRLGDEASTLKSKHGIAIECFVKDGKLYKAVEEFVKNHTVSLIIMGTHGVKGKDSFFLGSNAYKVVNNLKVPALAIQQSAVDPNFKRIFLPLDESFHTREKIPYAKQIAAAYTAEVIIAGLQKHHDKEAVQHLTSIVSQAEHYVSDRVDQVRTFMADAKDAAADTIHYAKQERADLIVIMSEQEKSLSGLFMGPAAQQVVSASTIPVLIVPPRVSLVMSNVSI